MAELATIARPYAEALFRASQADLGRAAAWLDELTAVAEDSRVLAYAADPRVTSTQVSDLISGVAEGAAQQPLPAQAKAFLQAVLENGRLQALPEIAKQFHVLSRTSAKACWMPRSTAPIRSKTRPWLISSPCWSASSAANSP